VRVGGATVPCAMQGAVGGPTPWLRASAQRARVRLEVRLHGCERATSAGAVGGAVSPESWTGRRPPCAPCDESVCGWEVVVPGTAPPCAPLPTRACAVGGAGARLMGGGSPIASVCGWRLVGCAFPAAARTGAIWRSPRARARRAPELVFGGQLAWAPTASNRGWRLRVYPHAFLQREQVRGGGKRGGPMPTRACGWRCSAPGMPVMRWRSRGR